MRSFAESLEEIAAPQALFSAWRRYRAGKRRRPAVARFEFDAERLLLALSETVLAGTYRPGPYRLLEVRDPKVRLIAIAGVGDRVLQRSIYDLLAPRFNRRFITDSYACLPGRGSHRAVLRFLELQRRYRYVLHLDICRYFPSVDHEILLGLLAPYLRDARITALLEKILASGADLYRQPEMVSFYGPPEGGRPRGMPIGNLTSQWWGNLYLDGLDHFAKRELKVKGLLRYMDGIVSFADDRATLKLWRRELAAWLWEHRRLRLNPHKGHIRSTELPQTYLGYRVTRQGYDLGAKAVRRFRKQVARGLEDGSQRFCRRLAAWRGSMTF